MLTAAQKSRITQIFTRNPATKGCLIQYRELNSAWPETVYRGDRCSDNYNRRIIIIEQVHSMSNAKALPPGYVANESVIGRELVGAGLSCFFFGLSVAAVTGGAAAAAPTAGASSAVVVLAWTGVVTGGAQCLNGVARVLEASTFTEDNSLQRWDSTEWYTDLVFWIDVAGVASGGLQLAHGVMSMKLWQQLMKQPTFVSRKLSADALAQMSRTERAAVMRQLMKEAEKTAEGQAAIRAALEEVQPGKGFVNQYPSSGLTATKARQLLPRVQDAADRSQLQLLQKQIADELPQVLRADAAELSSQWPTPLSMFTNALPSEYVGSASGSINYLIHSVDMSAFGE